MNRHYAYIPIVLVLLIMILYLTYDQYCTEKDPSCKRVSLAFMIVFGLALAGIGIFAAYETFFKEGVERRRIEKARANKEALAKKFQQAQVDVVEAAKKEGINIGRGY
jgi:hypothetical protein